MSSSVFHRDKELKVDMPLNLLIVDDETSALKAIKRYFFKSKYRIFTASSASEGLEIIKQENIQVVLSDFQMPQMSGGEFLKRLQTEQPDIVSMILTGHSDFDAAVDVMNAGAAFKFLSKPWSNDCLLKEVEGAFLEYDRRKAQKTARQLMSSQLTAEHLRLEQAVNRLIEKQVSFAICSIRIDDLHLLIKQISAGSNGNFKENYLVEYICDLSKQLLNLGTEFFVYATDHLVAVLPQTSSEDEIHRQLFELHEKLVKCHAIAGVEVFLNCSISYALSPFDGQTTTELLMNLRTILNPYGASLNSSNLSNKIMKLDEKQKNKQTRRLKIQSAIQGAINLNQFQLYFQPKVLLADQSVNGAEVLMRWQHSELGWISPQEFISLSELDGQIEYVGSWLIKASLKTFNQLQAKYQGQLSFSINISPRQLYTNRIVDQFDTLLEEYQIDPTKIELEITESCIFEDIEQAAKILWQLKLLGLNIAIDDFGAGYTSLAYLSKIPVDVLKLDKLLVDDIDTNADSHDILKSLIELSHKMAIKVVAEGAENMRQVDVLKTLNCDYVQGYVFSPAVDQQSFERIYTSQPFMLNR